MSDDNQDQRSEQERAAAEQAEAERQAAEQRGADEPAREATADAVITERVGSVNQEAADADAKRRNDELVEQGTLSDKGYIGSDASDLQG